MRDTDLLTRCRRKRVDTALRSLLRDVEEGARSGAAEIVGELPVAVLGTVFVANGASRRPRSERFGQQPTTTKP